MSERRICKQRKIIPVVQNPKDYECARADFNRNGLVDSLDTAIFMTYFAAGNRKADLNREGAVDLSDVIIFMSCLYRSSEQSPTPTAYPSATPTSIVPSPTPAWTVVPLRTPIPTGSPFPGAGPTPIATPPFTPTHTATPTQTATATPTSSGPALTPIARWDVVPYQRVSDAEPLNLGVVAFSADGIKHVEFHINSPKYLGVTPILVSQPTYNPQSNVQEYWAPLRASDFNSDGWITVEAVVVGNNGGRRDRLTSGGKKGLDPLPLLIDSSGTLPQRKAWVSIGSCNDNTAQIDNPSRPYCSPYLALKNVGSGGIVFLRPGTHNLNSAGNGDNVFAEEWMTFTSDPAAGGTKENTTLIGGNALANFQKLRIRNLTISRANGGGGIGPSCSFGCNNDSQVWMDNSIGIGAGQWVSGSFPISGNWVHRYFTEVDISRTDYPVGNVGGIHLVRNIVADQIGGDAFQDIPLIINAQISNIFPHYPIPTVFGANFQRSGDPDGLNVVRRVGAFANYQLNTRNTYTDGDRFYMIVANNELKEFKVVRRISDDAIEIGQAGAQGSPLPPSNPNATGFLSTGWHSDVWQHPLGDGGDANVILYNLKATDVVYQGLWIRNIQEVQPVARNVAIVNAYLRTASARPPHWNGWSGWYRSVDHLVLLHNTLQGGELSFHYNQESETNVTLTNTLVRGNMFTRVSQAQPEHQLDLSNWQSNHFEFSGGGNFVNPMVGSSVGDPLLSSGGVPLEGSPLINRYSPPLVRDDANGDLRDDEADLGAFERPAS